MERWDPGAAFPSIHYPAGHLVHAGLGRTADRLPERIAVTFEDETFSFREMDALSNAMARLLLEVGVRPGQRVGIMAMNRPEFVVALYAVLKTGAALVSMSTAWKDFELGHALELTEPTFVVHDSTAADLLGGRFKESQLIDVDASDFWTRLLDRSGERLTVEGLGDDAEAILVFSSGTTGLPKSVRHTHRSLSAAIEHWRSSLGLTEDDRFQIATPPFHILGVLNIVTAVAAGAQVRLHRRFDLDNLLFHAARDRTTLEMAVAPIALAMSRHSDLERFDLSAMRYIVWGATPINEAVARLVTERTGVRFMPGYGTSEVPVISMNPVRRPQLWRLDAAGIPVHDVVVRIADLDTHATLPDGESGEIQVRSPSTMVGYIPEAANADAFVDGWYRTGDVGWLEPGGWVHITDRFKEMIRVNGFQVAPAEIETVLLGSPAVLDCAVFGVEDEETGEAVIAAVRLAAGGGWSGDELKRLVRTSLASYKQLSHVAVVDEIPRLPSGKVLRRTLKEQWLASTG
jgi:long-chain acyl-CoA synthetase